MNGTTGNAGPRHQSTLYLVRRLIRQSVRPYVGWIVLAVVFMALMAGANALIAWLMEPIVNDVFIAKNRDVQGDERFYTVYTPRREQLATIHQTPGGYGLTRAGHDVQVDFVTLNEALEFVFPEAEPVRVHPDVRAS